MKRNFLIFVEMHNFAHKNDPDWETDKYILQESEFLEGKMYLFSNILLPVRWMILEKEEGNSEEIRNVYSKVVSAIEKGHFDLWSYSIQTSTNSGTVFESTEDVTQKELANLKILEKKNEWESIKLVLAERFYFYNRDLPKTTENALYTCLGKPLTENFIQDWWATLDEMDRYELKYGINTVL
jgi:hypothetical protein